MFAAFFKKSIEVYISAFEDEIIINMSEDALYEGFNLSKNTEEDYHIGELNSNQLLCPHCRCVIMHAGIAKKVKKDVSFIRLGLYAPR